MGFKCGIVGLPNVGKSTLFNALTKAGISAENYPFCTIEPNVGVVAIPDSRLDELAKIVKPQQVLPTVMHFVDIAGLVAGASKGEGLGNQFLAHIRETDAIAHVVRCFDDPNVIHVNNRVSPIDDIEVINTELALADMETVDKMILRVSKLAKTGNHDAKVELAVLERIKAQLDEGGYVRNMTFNEEEELIARRLPLLTAKPVLYIANVNEQHNIEDNPYFKLVQEYATREGARVVAICASIEAEIVQLDDADKMEFLAELGLEEPGLNRVIRAGHELLGLQTYFTAGKKEVRAWTVPVGCLAPRAAAAIHTDFERGFIRAEVIAYLDFITHQGEQGAKEAGKLRVEGKTYVVQDGDVMHFLFNV